MAIFCLFVCFERGCFLSRGGTSRMQTGVDFFLKAVLLC